MFVLFRSLSTLAEHNVLVALQKGSWECEQCFLVYSVYSPLAMGSKPRDIKDDNLLGIPQHFLIERRGALDSGVERSTGPVC